MIYAFFILALLVFIVFIAPDKMFEKKSDTELPVEKSLLNMQEELLNQQYEYKVNVLSSIGSTAVSYKCSGKKEKEKEEGVCTQPQEISYNETTKKEVLREINISYLEVDYIFALIKEKTPTIKEYDTSKIFSYEVTLNTLKTEITIITNKKHIIEVRLNNAYETYILSYSNIVY